MWSGRVYDRRCRIETARLIPWRYAAADHTGPALVYDVLINKVRRIQIQDQARFQDMQNNLGVRGREMDITMVMRDMGDESEDEDEGEDYEMGDFSEEDESGNDSEDDSEDESDDESDDDSDDESDDESEDESGDGDGPDGYDTDVDAMDESE